MFKTQNDPCILRKDQNVHVSHRPSVVRPFPTFSASSQTIPLAFWVTMVFFQFLHWPHLLGRWAFAHAAPWLSRELPLILQSPAQGSHPQESLHRAPHDAAPNRIIISFRVWASAKGITPPLVQAFDLISPAGLQLPENKGLGCLVHLCTH